MLAPAPALAQKVDFDVPEQRAVTGIPEFARQAKIQIVAPANIDGLRTRAVRGRLSVDEGLRRLLRGTALFVIARNGNAISLAARPRVVKRVTRMPSPRQPRAPVQPKAELPREQNPDPDIVVTGTIQPERKLDAGLAITTVTLDRIRELAPNNTADILKLAPGIWAETTGGATGANVFVRGFPTTGDAPFLTVQLDGAPIYPPTELAFSENTTLFRVDDMIDRVEILRGGTSPIYANGQPGAVMNFIQRTGTLELEGGLRLSTTDYGTRRADAYLTGPITPKTVFAIGGFYRASDGLRHTQFPADLGGQITANITHEFEGGRVTAYARYTRDRNAFYTGVPLLADGKGNFNALPGFDPLRDTLIGNDTRRLAIENGPGQSRSVDLSEGRGVALFLAGMSFEWSPDESIKITNRLNVTAGDANTIGLFTGPVPETLGQYLSKTIARANGDPRIVAAAGLASSGQGSLASNGLPITPDRYVLTAGLWSISERISSITDEFRVTRTIGTEHKLTAGFFIAKSKSEDLRLLGNNLLLLAEPNARRIDLRLNNGVQASRDGFVSATTGQVVGGSDSTNVALFLSDKWSASDSTTIDAGIRIEHQSLRGGVQNVLTGNDFDGNPLTIYNNNGARLLTTSRPLVDDAYRVSWAAGIVQRLVPDRLTLHARMNRGSNLQSFDKLRIGDQRTQSANVFEAGVDYADGPVRASINTFLNLFSGLQFTRLLAQPDGTIGSIVLTGGARAAGIEIETEVQPSEGWSIEFRGTYEDGRYKGFGGNAGHRIVRQPNLQFAVSPSYTAKVGSADLKVTGTYTYVGVRYSDVENLQRLPPYATVDAGLHFRLDNGVYINLIGQNLLDTFGLTEGNTRVLGAVLTSGPVIARPLFGRNLTVSFGYRF
ncbi:TonB-dependent receptor domain-containing protein [Sphingobium indicum]|uniref:TonB-dependent receptor domain-containing protein n=1 Tax=Sphingobium indicum TaxID=332055 RepID=UPI0017AE6C9B|nr:TonB-dependent receptor [Sphingobium indicum]NYI24257.1 outer membrane receptor protein involved in Fe transport [Sphingobium indicum]